MEKEIDVRALMMDKLSCEYRVENCAAFARGNEEMKAGSFNEELVPRNFNQNVWWSTSRQTEFIESIYMGCELPLIVVFVISENPIRYMIVDGINRIATIQNFLDDTLRLVPSHLKKATFLSNKCFSKLSSDDEKSYFLERGIQILEYSYTDKSHQLTEEEIDEIAKQLYIRYNSGIKLKNEEIQKATYEDDLLSKKMYSKMKDATFLKKLKNIYFTPLTSTKTFIDGTLMYCRLAITSCFAPLFLFCRQRSILAKIDTFYIDYTLEVDKDAILNDFIEIVSCLNELTEQNYWKAYPKLHKREFMLVTYWLLFNLKRNHLLSVQQFDWEDYIKFFGEKEEQKPLFSKYLINTKDRYEAVMDYMLEKYNVNLNDYLVPENMDLTSNKVSTFEQLPKYNFQLARDGIRISSLLDLLKDNAVILRPSYQRYEINNLKASSFIIESLALNMAIPDILVYRHEVNGKTVFEVTDGQQRCFSLLGFFKERYTNVYGECISSEKEGFALTGLTLCSDLNNMKYKGQKNPLPKIYENKIKNAKIRIVYIPEKDNPYFSVRDYFTNINKTIVPLSKTGFRYFNAGCDARLMHLASGIATNFQNDILPKADFKYSAQQFVVNLAYLFYYHQTYNTSFSVQSVANWLETFNKMKYKLINELKDEEVGNLRKKYIKSFEQVDAFLSKIKNWLSTEQKTLFDLFQKKNKKSTFTDILCLYYLLGDVSQVDLLNHSSKMYAIVSEYFLECAKNNLKKEERIGCISKYKDRLSFFAVRTAKMQQFRDKVNLVMNV